MLIPKAAWFQLRLRKSVRFPEWRHCASSHSFFTTTAKVSWLQSFATSNFSPDVAYIPKQGSRNWCNLVQTPCASCSPAAKANSGIELANFNLSFQSVVWSFLFKRFRFILSPFPAWGVLGVPQRGWNNLGGFTIYIFEQPCYWTFPLPFEQMLIQFVPINFSDR